MNSNATFSGSQYISAQGYINGAAYVADGRSVLSVTRSHAAISNSSGTPDYIIVKGTFETNDTTGKTLDFEWAQVSSSADDTKVTRNSSLTIKRIA